MKQLKNNRIAAYTVIALLINLIGRTMASALNLPIWCDAIGTCLMAYTAGPVCGAIVGFANNIIYGIFASNQWMYCFVGCIIGFLVGYVAKKGVYERQFTTMTFGMQLAVTTTVLSVLINIKFCEGATGNLWGDQIMLMFIDRGLPTFFASLLGQFYVEFVDKLICVEIIYILIRIVRVITKKKKNKGKKAIELLVVLALMSGLLSNSDIIYADEQDSGYDTYIQIVYSGADGLISGEANDIVQTEDGVLWIGTYAGLYKYDGRKFKIYSEINSINNVNCLFVDPDGRLWVGTNDDGVTILTNEQVMNVINEDNGLFSNSVRSITCDSHGNYYIGTSQGLSVVSLSGGARVTNSFDDIKNVVDMSADKNGNVAVVTDRGVLHWINDGEIEQPPVEVKKSDSFLASYFTEDNRLFLATKGNEVLVYDMSQEEPVQIDVVNTGLERINDLYTVDNKEIFICADNGVAVWKDSVVTKINTRNFSSSIDNMLIDYQGNLWFCSSRLGLLKMCKTAFKELFREIGENEVVNTIYKWNNLLYCGTDDGIIVIDENKAEKVDNELTKLLAGVRVRCIMSDSAGALWIATSGSGIYKVTADDKGKLIIRNFTENDNLPGMRFRNIIETDAGEIVVAGDYGVAYIFDDVVVESFTLANGLVNEKSLCLLEKDGAVYVGSDGGGISKIEGGRIVRTIEKKDGLSSPVILRMVADPYSNGVFIVTSNGLCYYAPDNEKILHLDNFPYSNNYDIICNENGKCFVLGSAGIFVADTDNLISNTERDYPLINSKRGFMSTLVANSWTYIENNEVYLCCDTGAVKVDMNNYEVGADSYRMVLDQVMVDGVATKINRFDTLKISSRAEKIVFEPEIINYSMNDPYVSLYLEGYDENPMICLLSELDTVTYMNLKPGIYTFTIAVLDGADKNVVEAADYTIEKEMQMYQKWWFKVYVIGVASLVLVWITWFITRAHAQKAIMEHQLALEYAKKQINMGNETILSIARTVDAKDSNTSKHSIRVSEYSVAIAKRLGYSPKKCENLRKMALLHDIGKIGIPDAILNKPSKLTKEEYEIMKTHVTRGGEILKDFTMIENVKLGALYHHEKYDGTGYCSGLKGEEIPLDARIIGIADAFDAMTANRVYRQRLNLDEVLSELKRCSGTQFDPVLVDTLLSLIEDKTINVEELYAKSKGEM